MKSLRSRGWMLFIPAILVGCFWFNTGLAKMIVLSSESLAESDWLARFPLWDSLLSPLRPVALARSSRRFAPDASPDRFVPCVNSCTRGPSGAGGGVSGPRGGGWPGGRKGKAWSRPLILLLS